MTFQKELLDGYIGIKFKAECSSKDIPQHVPPLFKAFKENTLKLKEYNMTPKNGGNISIRWQDGLVISSSGSNLGLLEEEEIVYVSKCDVDEGCVAYFGDLKPSSETLMHYLILNNYQKAQAVVHAHDLLGTTEERIKGKIKQSTREEPYGTLELAHMALQTFQGGSNIILLKNHGYVSYGLDLYQATDTIIEMHKKLMS